MKSSVLIALVAPVLFASISLATTLENVSLEVGANARDPKSFVKCAINAGLEAAFDGEASLVAVQEITPLDNNEASPSSVVIQFTAKNTYGDKDSFRIILTSDDAAKKWQIARGPDGQSYYFSSKVSAMGKFTKKGADIKQLFFLGKCQF